MEFRDELYCFLRDCCPDVSDTVSYGLDVFICGEGRLAVIVVPLAFFGTDAFPEMFAELEALYGKGDRVYVYEDRWISCGPLVRSMLRVRLGLGSRVYARNCDVREIGAGVAADFLAKNHVYGPARAAYRFGLFRRRATGACETGMDEVSGLLAVATFSAGRAMDDGSVSYEWIRYASLRNVRVVGGMGRLLDAFAGHAGRGGRFSVMTYSDREWYGGKSYESLGFECEGELPPVQFYCGSNGNGRIHAGKVGADRKYRDVDTAGMVRICNLGSARYVRYY